ncbi:N-acetylmuramoyl-L-alanine amidase family protein [Gracilibacillus xinjiangensis]|uniref:N-acetylmuramoyl-L-alanine amidase n=1 Tax=Gracilibacillus xinjiangensis TaxID=1193282 RepID=A0ABV8WS17_9BACI
MVKIYIDPGHGGTDPGAFANGLREKDLTLKISLIIRDLLKQYEDVQVRLSRTTDKTLSLKQRTDDANIWGADYLISVHINAGGGTGYEDFIYNKLSDSSSTARKQDIMHEEIIKKVNMYDRGKKKANFHMVRESNMEAILTENGFIDAAHDSARLKSDEFLNDIAKGHVNGLVRIFNLKKRSEGGITEMEAQQLQKQIDELKALLNQKLDKPNNPSVPSNWAVDVWKKQVMQGYFDGSNPKMPLTREQAAEVLDRFAAKIREYEVDPLKKRVDALEEQVKELSK